jgi:hypothetical protein
MEQSTPDFSLKQGDPRTLNLTITGFQTIASFVITMSCKRTLADAAPRWTETATITNPISGLCSIALTAPDTSIPEGTYIYDIKVVDNNGVPQHTQRSTFEITRVVT